MSEIPTPYIGISGIIDTAQQTYFTEEFPWSTDRIPAFGVKAVHKTQFLDIANKYGPEWYPVGEAFTEVLRPIEPSLRVAQVYFDSEQVQDSAYRQAFIEKIHRRGVAWLNALQFDMLPWHHDEKLLPFLEQTKETTGYQILLQVHGEAMQELGPKGVMNRLGKYAGVLDYILFDASHGKGVRLNTHALRPFVASAYDSKKLETVGVSVAGGLNGQVVRDNLSTLVKEFPDLSWDAEGQLHPERQDGTRELDWRETEFYLDESFKLLGGVY